MPAAVEADFVHAGRGAKFLEDGVDQSYDLVLGPGVGHAENIGVELPVFAQPSPLWPLIAPKIRDAVPPQGIGQLLPPAGHHAADCRRHLRSDNDFSATAVFKDVSLLVDDFLA